MRGKTKWKKGEVPHCEIDHVEMPLELGEPIVFHLTPRGAAEHKRRQEAWEKEQAQIKKDIASGKYGIPIDWILNGTGAGRYWG